MASETDEWWMEDASDSNPWGCALLLFAIALSWLIIFAAVFYL
jgi:hypothetical protein